MVCVCECEGVWVKDDATYMHTTPAVDTDTGTLCKLYCPAM